MEETVGNAMRLNYMLILNYFIHNLCQIYAIMIKHQLPFAFCIF